MRSWLILTLAFGSLIGLICFFGVATLHRAKGVYANLSELNQNYRHSEAALEEIRAGIHVSSMLVRDYLLDPSGLRDVYYRGELHSLYDQTEKELDELSKLDNGDNLSHLETLRKEVNRYWQSLNPVFEWTPKQKLALSYQFLHQEVMQHTTAVLELTKEVHALNEASFRAQQADIAESERQFKQYLVRMLIVLEFLGCLIAFACVYRVVFLERRTRGERERAETAEGQLRRLSDQLVQTQEEERRSISRELHDEVGQMLTGLRMELRSLRRLQDGPREQFEMRIEQTKALLDRTLQAVRDIAMGLRPSMLDDLGLGPALEWQGRDFSRRYDIPVTVNVDAALDNLPDHYRTNIFRIVQEALTNCARHAQATSVQISLQEQDGSVRLAIADDGVGMDRTSPRKGGLGLMGIQERVRKLGGQLSIDSSAMHGTLLSVEIPEHLVLAAHD